MNHDLETGMFPQPGLFPFPIIPRLEQKGQCFIYSTKHVSEGSDTLPLDIICFSV